MTYLTPQKYIIMFFLYLAIDQCKITIKEPIATPEVYPISVSTRIMDITGEKTWIPDDPDCPKENFDDPSTSKCGQICTSDKGATFSYKFKGVQFLVIKIPIWHLQTLFRWWRSINEKQDTEENYALLCT